MTEEELKKALNKQTELLEENNKILRQMRSQNRWNRLFKALYWVAIIAVFVIIYQYVQPIWAEMKGFMNEGQGLIDSLRSGINDISN